MTTNTDNNNNNADLIDMVLETSKKTDALADMFAAFLAAQTQAKVEEKPTKSKGKKQEEKEEKLPDDYSRVDGNLEYGAYKGNPMLAVKVGRDTLNMGRRKWAIVVAALTGPQAEDIKRWARNEKAKK